MRKKGRINSTHVFYDNIEFKSIFEFDVYKFLVENGLCPKYEPQTFVLWHGGKTVTPFYNAKTKHLRHYKADLDDISYTPDFVFEYEGKQVFVEAKGFENDSFPIRKKMFRKYLDENIENALFFEVRSILQLNDMIEILRYGKLNNNKKKRKKP